MYVCIYMCVCVCYSKYFRFRNIHFIASFFLCMEALQTRMGQIKCRE